MDKDKQKSRKKKIVILTFDCEEFNSLPDALEEARKFSKGHIAGAREIWHVNKKICWSEQSRRRKEEQINKYILFFFGDKYESLKDLLSDPSLNEFLQCTKSKIFVTEERIPWPD